MRLMVIWNSLPKDIWWLVIQKLTLTDHIPFSCVCKLWRSIVSEYRITNIPIHVPALVIPGNPSTTTSQTRRLLPYPVGKNTDNHKLDLPLLSIPHLDLCRGSYQGWLVMVTNAMDMYLYNPLTGAQIDLPPVTSFRGSPVRQWYSKWSIHKAILSENPSSKASDCFVLVFWGKGEIGFCRLGDISWRYIECPSSRGYIDAMFYIDKFYVVDVDGKAYVTDLTPVDWSSEGARADELAIPPPIHIPTIGKWYLVELEGQLLQIHRKISMSGHEEDGGDNDQHLAGGEGGEIAPAEGEDGVEVLGQDNDKVEGHEKEKIRHEKDGYIFTNFDDFDYDNNFLSDERNSTYQTSMFRVFKLDTGDGSEPRWIEVKDLNGGAIFVGMNQSFALPRSNLMGYDGDRIYYTDDNNDAQKWFICSGNDMGVFHLKDSNIRPLCINPNSNSLKPHPVWITLMGL